MKGKDSGHKAIRLNPATSSRDKARGRIAKNDSVVYVKPEYVHSWKVRLIENGKGSAIKDR